jgi:hypothetical protein
MSSSSEESFSDAIRDAIRCNQMQSAYLMMQDELELRGELLRCNQRCNQMQSAYLMMQDELELRGELLRPVLELLGRVMQAERTVAGVE